MIDRLLDVSIVARRLRVSDVTVRNWIRAGRLAAERTLTGRYHIRASVLAAIIQKNEINERDNRNR